MPTYTDSRRAGVSHKGKFVHRGLVNHLVKACTGKNVVSLTDRLNMVIAVDWDVKPQTKQKSWTLFECQTV